MTLEELKRWLMDRNEMLRAYFRRALGLEFDVEALVKESKAQVWKARRTFIDLVAAEALLRRVMQELVQANRGQEVMVLLPQRRALAARGCDSLVVIAGQWEHKVIQRYGEAILKLFAEYREQGQRKEPWQNTKRLQNARMMELVDGMLECFAEKGLFLPFNVLAYWLGLKEATLRGMLSRWRASKEKCDE